jgi:CNT family concentrative nucleoside transporter
MPLESILNRLVPVLGLLVLMGIALAMSVDRRAALRRWPLILWGLGLQLVFALLVLKTKIGALFFKALNDIFIVLIDCTYAGSEFVFGALATPFGPRNMATVGYVEARLAGDASAVNGGFVFAFSVLSVVIFFSAITSLLFHFGILQRVVNATSWVMVRTLRTSGAETVSASANIFLGQSESPLVVRPYLANMTRSELATVMTAGFATVAGSVMGLYVMTLSGVVENIAGHLFSASVMSAPAALLFAKLVYPETEQPATLGQTGVVIERQSSNALDAISLGTSDGLKLAATIAAMLLAFLAIIKLFDTLILEGVRLFLWPLLGLEAANAFAAEPPSWLTLQGLASYLFTPLAWVMGVTDWSEAVQVGRLLGTKMIANEFVAYLELGQMSELSPRAKIIATYALCGFANFGSMGIQIGGLSILAPSRRRDLTQLALPCMIAGTMAANATACIAAILL